MTSFHVMHIIGSSGLYGAEKWILAFFRAAVTARYPIRLSLVNLTENDGRISEVVKACRALGILALDLNTGGRYNPIAGIKLGLWAKRNGVNLFHSHGFKGDTIGLIASRLAKAKILATPHGWSLEKDLRLRVYEAFDRLLLRFMDCIVPLSPRLYSDLRTGGFTKDRVKLIVNGVDIDEVDSIRKPSREEDAEGSFVVGYVGQLIERKNVASLLKAIKLLSTSKRHIRLVVVGDGYQNSRLKDEVDKLGIRRYVKFYGFRDDALGILKTLDLLVLPSFMEGIPRCVMEAMAAMVPVVVSDIPGNRELVTHGQTGLLFNPCSVEELVKCIEYVMQKGHSTKAMLKRARQKIEKEYSNHRMVQQYIELYDSLLSARAGEE